MVEVAVVERGFEVQQGGGHLHRQFGRRLGTQRRGVGDRHLQRAPEQAAVRVEPHQGIGHQHELLGQAPDAGQVAPRHGRPDLLGRSHPLARLGHPGRVEAAQAGPLVINRRRIGQLVTLAHHRQARPGLAAVARRGLGAEEQQVMGQSLGRLGRLTGPQLRQQARAQTLAVGVQLQQAVGLGFEETRRQLPQRGQPAVRRPRAVLQPALLARHRLGTGGQAREQLAHARCHAGRCAAHQRQQVGLDAVEGVVVGMTLRHLGVKHGLAPGPLHRPQVGRVHALGTGQLLQGLVGREQRQRGHRLAGQAPVDEFQQGEGAMLDGIHGGRCQQLGPAADALQRGFGGTQQLGRPAQADQFEHAHALVDLAARLAQHVRVDGVEVAALGLLLEEAAQRLVRRLERTAQLLLHPGQGAEGVLYARIADRRHGLRGFCCRVGCRGAAGGRRLGGAAIRRS